MFLLSPVAALQSRAVVSQEPVRTVAPSGLNAADKIGPLWPFSSLVKRRNLVAYW